MFLFLLGTAQASESNVFDNAPTEEAEGQQENLFEETVQGDPVIPGGGGVGGVGVGEAVPIDQYQAGLFVGGIFLVLFYRKLSRRMRPENGHA